MGAIPKLNYLNDTKDLIKEKLNQFNAGITDEDTFRSYVDKIKGIYNSWPKVTAEGTELSLSPTRKGKMEIDLKGNTEQQSYTGKQLFKDEYIGLPNRNNKNAVLSAGTYTLATCDGEIFSKNIYITLFDTNKNVITESGHITSSNVTFSFSDTSYVYYAGSAVSYITFTLDSDYILNIGLLNSDNTRQVVLVSGTTVDRDYEPYVGGVPAPNPDYPQDIHVVSGDNTISFEPYTHTDYPLNLGSMELCKIGDVQDFIFKNTPNSEYYDSSLVENGWYKYGNIDKVGLDGTEGWTKYSNTNIYFANTSKLLLPKNEGLNVYCDNYTSVLSQSNISDFVNETNNLDFAIGVHRTSTIIRIKNTNINTESDMASELSTHNTTVYYVLEIPTRTQITDATLIKQLEAISNAMSINNTTSITQTNADLPFIISASALKKGGN